MNTPDVSKIVEIGLTYPEIGNKQIADLFGASSTAVTRLKKPVQEAMIKRSIRTWNPKNVNTKIAFEVWGIDLERAERAYQKLKTLGIAGSSEEPHPHHTTPTVR